MKDDRASPECFSQRSGLAQNQLTCRKTLVVETQVVELSHQSQNKMPAQDRQQQQGKQLLLQFS